MSATIAAREARVRRACRRDGQSLHKARSDYDELGPYYVVDDRTNAVVAFGCTLESLEADQ